MSTISIQELQRDLAEYLRRVKSGEAFVVVQDDEPLAEVRPVAIAATEPRPYGSVPGRFKVSHDFDRPLPDQIIQEFEGA